MIVFSQYAIYSGELVHGQIYGSTSVWPREMHCGALKGYDNCFLPLLVLEAENNPSDNAVAIFKEVQITGTQSKSRFQAL